MTLGPVPSKRGSTLEVSAASSNPANAETDGDGLADDTERNRGTNPFVFDTDHDGLSDDVEVNEKGTDPTDPDTDGDGLLDGEEGAILVRYHSGSENPTRSYSDPLKADTDGDGRLDSAELGLPNANGVHDEATSSPILVDTDSDGLHDSAELAWKTDPLSTDSDDDNFIDFVDRRPNTEDTPPKVLIQPTIGNELGPMYATEIRIIVFDDSRVKRVEVNGSYNPPVVDQRWRTSKVYLEKRLDGRPGQRRHITVYESSLVRKGVLRPSEYYVNVTDAHGNTLSLHIQPHKSDVLSDLTGKVNATAKAVAAAAPAAVSTQATPLTGTIGAGASTGALGGALLGLGTVAAWYPNRARTSADINPVSKQSVVIPGGLANAKTIQNANDLPVKLPSGAVFDEPPVTIGDTNPVRGYGEELITRVPGVNDRDSIQYVLNHPSATEYDGPYEVVIGDTQEGSVLQIHKIENIIIRVRSVEEWHTPKPTDKNVIYDPNYWTGDGHGNQDDHLDRDVMKEVVNNPDEIWSNGVKYLWVKEINGVTYFVRGEDFDKRQNIGLEGLRLRSSYFKKSKQKAKEKLEDIIRPHNLNKIYPEE